MPSAAEIYLQRIWDLIRNGVQLSNGVEVSYPDTSFTYTPTLLGGAAYAAGDAIGALIPLTDICYDNGKPIIVQNAMIMDKSEQTFTCTVLIFNSEPSASSVVDNTPLNVVDADADKLHAMIAFTSFKDVGGCKVSQSDDRSLQITPLAASKTLYAGVILDTGTPTFAVGDIKLVLEVMRAA
jgi:hypothetical protein